MDTTQRKQTLSRSLLLAGACLALVANLAACHQSPLHRSYALRYREMMAAQANAHPVHDSPARGEEAAHAVGNYYNRYDQSAQGGGGGTSRSGPQPTAGVMPLH